MPIGREVEIIDYVDELRDIVEIWGNCDVKNKEAIELLEKFESVALESIWKGEWRSDYEYAERFSCRGSNPYVF